MEGEGAINRSFLNDLNRAQQYYNENKLDECIELCRDLLTDDAIPRWHRIKTLILLGGTLADPYKAASCLDEAQALWHMVNKRTRRGDDPRIDHGLAELKTDLKELADALDIETSEQELREEASAQMASLRLAEEDELLEADNDDPMELHQADFPSETENPETGGTASTTGGGNHKIHTGHASAARSASNVRRTPAERSRALRDTKLGLLSKKSLSDIRKERAAGKR